MSTREKRLKRVRRNSRNGLVLLISVGCVFICVAIFGMLLQQVVRSTQQTRMRYATMQNRWLVESGLERAVARMAVDDQYQGETWLVSKADLGGKWNAELVLLVEPLPDSSDGLRQVTVIATYPAQSTLHKKTTKRFVVSGRQMELAADADGRETSGPGTSGRETNQNDANRDDPITASPPTVPAASTEAPNTSDVESNE